MDNLNSNMQPDIDLRALFQTLWNRRKVFYWVLPITFVLSSALILCVPRYYSCEVVLAPEVQSDGASGSLQSLASSFGIDMHSLSNADAIFPMIYPDVVSSHDFILMLFDMPVETVDHSFSGTYYEYLSKMYKKPFWTRWKGKIVSLLPKRKEIMPQIASDAANTNRSFCLTKKQWDIIELIRDNITCTVDRRTYLITFRVKAQDKLVCAAMGDSVCNAMQRFIVEYRTKKTQNDIVYYEQIMSEAYKEYQEASQRYISFVDGHNGVNQERYRTTVRNLETEMDIKQSIHTSYQKQYLAARARLQEKTPVFTTIQSATVPIKPAGPKRMIFVLAMLFIATFVTIGVVCKDQLLSLL